MSRRRRTDGVAGTAVIALAAPAWLAACLGGPSADEAQRPPLALRATGVHENPTANEPSRTAWELFLNVNQPVAENPGFVAWETWADAWEVFGDPNCRHFPPWPTGVRPKHLEELPRQQQMFRQKIQEEAREQGLAPPSFDGARPTLSEVRFNRQAYDWIGTKRLWYLDQDGQEEAFEVHADGGEMEVEFRAGSLLIKAAWEPIDERDKPRYFWHEIAGVPHGLTALHIVSKALPRWFWATWEHADNPGRERATRLATHKDDILEADLDGLFEASGLDRERWGNYRLIGTQTTFTDTLGHPSLLGNSVLEDGFLTDSSCMTCHARSTIGRNGRRLEAFEPRPHIGAPDPRWFTNRAGSEPVYLQLDFMWSLARAQPRDSTKVHACGGPAR